MSRSTPMRCLTPDLARASKQVPPTPPRPSTNTVEFRNCSTESSPNNPMVLFNKSVDFIHTPYKLISELVFEKGILPFGIVPGVFFNILKDLL